MNSDQQDKANERLEEDDAPSAPPLKLPLKSALITPSLAALRYELQEAVVRDLLGPAGGPAEELPIQEQSVRERYLVGTLAPRHQLLEPEEFDELADSVPSSPEEGVAEASAPASQTMFPSSIGLTFCVDGAETHLRVTARWGWYQRAASEIAFHAKTGEPRKVWKRTPVEQTLTFALTPGALDRWSPNEDQPEVQVRGIARKKEGDPDWTITFFLINGQKEPKQSRDTAWLFQPELIIEGANGGAVFSRRATRRTGEHLDAVVFAELQSLEMIYRKQPEFAMGHGVSVHSEASSDDPMRAVRLSTRVVPCSELPRSLPPTREEEPALASLVLDMRELAQTSDQDFPVKLGALVSAYGDWITNQAKRIDEPDSGLKPYKATANDSLARCQLARSRIEAGINLLAADPKAAEAFRFANRAMWQQRIHARFAEEMRRGENPIWDVVDVPAQRTWFPFQLAFILLNLPGITDLNHAERNESPSAVADLLWYPTGGGKTEAYLGLTAYTLGLRRLQGVVAGRSGEQGIAVLMRYTLRLLTLQQFQRATALICACEMTRREAVEKGDYRWGRTQFRIGLWVGNKTTPNWTEEADEALKQHHGIGKGSGGDPAQLTSCPWCGSAIDKGKNIKVDKGRGRTLIYCGDPLGRCPFSERKAPGEGLPVLVVDEEIYRQLPSLLIATVDKFAQLPWNGITQMLFGQVNGLCDRHGFRSPDLEDSDTHPKSGVLPAAKTIAYGPLRPPDLIIQDELHLISGPLGTLVGLYETAIDLLCSWQVDGKQVRPKVIASTATIRNAQAQVHKLFLRSVSVFPPPGLTVNDNFFARQVTPDENRPGRIYLGICAPGKRLKAVLIRVYLAYLSAGQQLYNKYGKAADPWMTLVGYFNSMRELGGMRRLVDDDIRSRLYRMEARGLAKRNPPDVKELTSRVHSGDIPTLLDRLEVGFDPIIEAERKKLRAEGKKLDAPYPIDVLLATNMLSVGVDVKRLGLMVVAGQPKTTAEYIQATSRVGRTHPGIVCTVLNWARPRDLSHYEQFEHYHATFYQYVEALSVTPFASRAIDRGLSALLVACVRNLGTEYNANSKAAVLNRDHPFVKQALQTIVQRAWEVEGSDKTRDRVRQELESRLDYWLNRAQKTMGGSHLGYKSKKDGLTVPLLQPTGQGMWEAFTCLNSLRDVEPTINLILDDHGLDVDPPDGLAQPVTTSFISAALEEILP
jgi:hypothetical protein